MACTQKSRTFTECGLRRYILPCQISRCSSLPVKTETNKLAEKNVGVFADDRIIDECSLWRHLYTGTACKQHIVSSARLARREMATRVTFIDNSAVYEHAHRLLRHVVCLILHFLFCFRKRITF